MDYSYEIVRAGGTKAVFLNFTMHREDGGKEDICERITRKMPDALFSFVNVYADDWNRDYSPWEFKDEQTHKDFAGGGAQLLAWVRDFLLPELGRELSPEAENELCKPQSDSALPQSAPAASLSAPNLCAGGYSLAGLFALWITYETGLFKGCVSGSASLWFPGMTGYAETHKLCQLTRIYMSLGTKEEKTRDRYMSSVGDATRRIYEIMEADDSVVDRVLEWNPGNHFNDVDGRMARGYEWMLEHMEV